MGNSPSKRIKRAAKKEKTVLSFRNEGLKKLPESIGTVVTLEELMLDHNRLKTVPKQIGELKNLQRLNLFSNRLKELPVCCSFFLPSSSSPFLKPSSSARMKYASVQSLLNLIFLSIEFASFQLFLILWLTSFSSTNMQLTVMPRGMGGLNTLRVLDISENNITEISRQIGTSTLAAHFSVGLIADACFQGILSHFVSSMQVTTKLKISLLSLEIAKL
jgi:Leucine-rich repeat (LRR) protein